VRGKERLLRDILIPSLEIEQGYATQVIETGSGENLIGLKSNGNANTITLRQPNGVEFVMPRANVAGAVTQAWSLMPEGLEEGLTPEQMADLLEYVMTQEK
jgi:putative heme-binding domain-containing protein